MKTTALSNHITLQIWTLLVALYGVNNVLAQTTETLNIAPTGNTVELEMVTSSNDQYVLETQAQLMEGEEWEPVMFFKGTPSKPRTFTDPICGTSDARFFRLKKRLAAPPRQASNFRLLDLQGQAHELYYHWDAKGIVLLLAGDQPEFIETWAPDLAEISANYDPDSLHIWNVLLSDENDRESLLERFGSNSLTLPILQDLTQAVTRTLSSGEVPEAILVNTRDWSIAYRGPVTLNVDTGKSVTDWAPLTEAIEALMAGSEPEVTRLRPFGVANGVDALPETTYSEHIAPMLQQHCFPCHTPGDIAPWAMTSYDVIQEFSGLIKSAVLAGEMPPWHADPKYSAFSNTKSMSDEEIATLVDWIDRGAPRGDGGDPLAETETPEPVDWPLGKPDHVVSIPLQSIPAQGSVDYKYFFSESPFDSDVWLKAAAVKPGDRSVVHHCLVFKGTMSELIALRGGLAGFFAGYVPGMEQVPFPEGTGKKLRKNDLIVFQMHYTTNGKAATDQTQLGFYLADEPPRREIVTSAAYDVNFRIPPNSRDVRVQATQRFDRASTIYEFSPHMHYRGAAAKFTLKYPDGSQEVVLSVPAYFFDWQALYRLEAPKQVPAGTVMICEGWFDNTAQNRFNPDPNDTVSFGEQSWEEMFIGYFNYAEN
jgi:hypothetical protein